MPDTRLARWRQGLTKVVVSPTPGRTWWVIVSVAALAAFLVAVFVSSELKAAKIVPDFRVGYHPGALNIQRGRGYVDQTGEFITQWPPGMSILASPWVVDDVGESARNLRFVSGFLAAIWVVSVASLARLIAPRVSTAVVLGLAVFWPPMWTIGDPMGSEMLFTALSTVAVYLLVRLYRLREVSAFNITSLTAGAWLLFGAAALTRTIGIAVAGAMFVGIAFGFRTWSTRRRSAVLAMSAAVFAAALAPWVWVYKEHTGHFGFTSAGFRSIQYGLERYSSFPLGLALTERSEKWESYSDMWADLRDLSVADPAGALRLIGTKLVDPWWSTTSRKYDRYLLWVQLPWLLLYCWASCRTVRHWRRTPGEVVLLHGFVAALWLTAALIDALLRYLSPAFPFVVLIVAWHLLDANVLGRETAEVRYPLSPAGLARHGSNHV